MLKATSTLTAIGLGLSSLSLASVPAKAGGEGVAAGIIGFAAGAIVGSQLNKQRSGQRTYRSAAPKRTQAEREYWMSIQDSLNRVGYNAGPVDGAPGRKTRDAIRSFQLSIPSEPTGQLTPEQTQLLFARANPQQFAPPQQVNVAPPAGYQQQPAQAFPNVTLPGNGTAGTVAPVTNEQVSFPAPNTAQEAPSVPAPAAPASFPSVSTPTVTATTDGQGLPPAGEVPSFPAVDSAAIVDPSTAPANDTQVANANETDGAIEFPAVNDGAPAVSETPITAEQAPAAPAAQAPQQAQIQIDANGQPFILVNGQKFFLQSAPAPAPQ